MAVQVTEPITGDLIVYMDTDNVFDIRVDDEDGTQLDVTGWTANLEVDDSADTWAVKKLDVAASVVPDPEDAAKTVLRIAVTDDLLQPGTASNQWEEKKYPYSVKRTNAGAEKIVRKGRFDVRRARQ